MMVINTLPDLPCEDAALKPAISGEILEQNQDKHASYVKGANDPFEQPAGSRDTGQFGTLVGLKKTLAFGLSGHGLHSIFWQNLSGDGGDRPDGALACAPLGWRLIVRRFTTITATSATPVSRGWSSMPGNMRATCRTGTSAPTTPASSGISSTGPMSSPAISRRRPARPEPAAGHDAA
jgi:hypothetical protein